MGEMPEQKLAALLGGALEDAVAQKIDSFGGLLSRGAAVRLLCQENGISIEEKVLLSDARATLLPFSFSARVDRVFPIQEFSGGSSCSLRLHISDASGSATLLLWNEQAHRAENGIFSGDTIACAGAYFRAGEISIGRKGSFAKEGGKSAATVAALPEGVCNVEGTVEQSEGGRVYKDRKTGEEKTMASFSICSGGKCCRAIWWSPPIGAPMPCDGDSVVLENANARNDEIHLNSFSRLVVQGPGNRLSGEFLGVSFDEGRAIVSIGDEKFSMGIDDAALLFGMPPALPGVLPQTLLSIKSGALLGRKAAYSVVGKKLSSLKIEG
jgi:hypothetical protein